MRIWTSLQSLGAVTGSSQDLNNCIPRLRLNRFKTNKLDIVIRFTSVARHL